MARCLETNIQVTSQSKLQCRFSCIHVLMSKKCSPMVRRERLEHSDKEGEAGGESSKRCKRGLD